MGYRRPSHRNPCDVQSEVCELCGKLIGHAHLIEADCDGLRGRIVCGGHPMLDWSFQDYRAHNGLMPSPDTSRRQPIGASFWFLDVAMGAVSHSSLSPLSVTVV